MNKKETGNTSTELDLNGGEYFGTAAKDNHSNFKWMLEIIFCYIYAH
jgi:hypothetical protein